MVAYSDRGAGNDQKLFFFWGGGGGGGLRSLSAFSFLNSFKCLLIRDKKCTVHDLEVMTSNAFRVEVEVHSTVHSTVNSKSN